MQHHVLAIATILLSAACGSSPVTPQQTPAPSPSPSPSPIFSNYRLTGVVMDAGGSPIAGALIAFQSSAGRDITRTDSAGAYAVENIPHTVGFAGLIGALGVVTASAPGHWENIQAVMTAGSAEVTRNLRLRRVVGITTGESIVLTMDADSSLVGEVVAEDGDFPPYWELRTIREKFVVNNVEAGRLHVQGDNANDGSGYPFIEACRVWPLGCSWAGGSRNSQRTVSFNVGGAEQYEITVTVPSRPDHPRRYTMTTLRTP